MTRHFNPAGAVLDALNDLLQGPHSALRKAELALAMSPDDEDPGVGRDPDDYLLSEPQEILEHHREPQDDLDAGATFDPDEETDV